jgi:hypothetical protein
MARRASAWTTHPCRAACPRSPNRSRSGARKARSPAATHTCKGAARTTTWPSQLTLPARSLKRPLEAPACLQVQVAAWLVLVQVKYKRERSLSARPPGVEKTSRLRSMDRVDRGVKCKPLGGKNSKMKSRTVSWLSHKTKVEPGLRGSRVMSGDWRRLHQVHRVCGGSP